MSQSADPTEPPARTACLGALPKTVTSPWRGGGHGGVRLVTEAAGVAASTASRGLRELGQGEEPDSRVRALGGGRKRLRDADPVLVPALLALVEPDQRGDPESPLRWTVKRPHGPIVLPGTKQLFFDSSQGDAGSAPSLLAAAVAASTSTILVGTGGVMLRSLWSDISG